jgi:CelD/BcsL family acetyltransferase involved in cellulose biosynthesis
MTTVAPPEAIQLERHRSFDAIAGEWDELADRAGAAPFLRPGWFEAWLRAFGDGADPLVLAARRGDRLEAVLLLLDGRRMRSPTNSHTPVFDLVSDDEEAARTVVDELLGLGFQQLDLTYLDADGALLAAWRELTAERRLDAVRTQMRSPYVPLEGDFEAFRAGLSRGFRRELGRSRRRLAEAGELSFEFTDGGDDLDGLLDTGFELEASGWKLEAGTAIVSRPNRAAFYREVAAWARERGWLTLAFARLDGRAIAFDFCVEQGGRVCVLKGGYDPEWRKHAPGYLLIEDTIERAYANGRESYELLGDADEYKLRLTDSVRERDHLQAFGRGPGGRVRMIGHRYVRPLLKRGG